MKKTKNKKSKAGKKTMLSGAAKSLKKLTTTQKVVGGAALVALGVSYLAKRRSTASGPAATAAEETLAAMDETQA